MIAHSRAVDNALDPKPIPVFGIFLLVLIVPPDWMVGLVDGRVPGVLHLRPGVVNPLLLSLGAQFGMLILAISNWVRTSRRRTFSCRPDTAWAS